MAPRSRAASTNPVGGPRKSEEDLASPMRRQVSVYKALAEQAAKDAENAPKSRKVSIEPGTYARLCYQKADRQEVRGQFRRSKDIVEPKKAKKSPRKVKKTPKKVKKTPKKTKKTKKSKQSAPAPVEEPKVEIPSVRASYEDNDDLEVSVRPVPVRSPSIDKFEKFQQMKQRRESMCTVTETTPVTSKPDNFKKFQLMKQRRASMCSRQNSTEEPELPRLSSVENQVELEAIRATLKSGKKTVAYKQEPKPEVRKSTGEAHFAVEKAALLKSSGRFVVKPAQKASLSRRESAIQLEEPEKEQVTLSMVRQNTVRVAGVAKDTIVLTKGKSATAFKAPKALKQRLVQGKSMTKYETPVVEPAKLSAAVSSTQLAEPQKEVVRTIRSKSFVAFKAPVVVPAKLALGEAATAYELVQKVEEAPKLARSRSAIKLKYTKVVAPEPIKLALSEDATELAEPQKPVVEAVKLVRSKSATVLKEPQKVAPKPVKLALTESATELTEPAEKVEEPVKLARTRSAIRMRVPAKKVIKLLEGENDFTHKTRKASLSRQVGGTSFSAKKVVEEPAQLTKGSEDVTVTEKKQKLVAVNKVVSYKQSKQVLVLSNTSVDQEKVAVVLSNTSRDFVRDELVSTENGLDVEEEYDWSYLKWYAGGVATQYLLGGRGSVRHVHHNSKKSGRKE